MNLTKESQKKKKHAVTGNINSHSYSQKIMHIGPLTFGQRCYCYRIAMSEGLKAFLMLETEQRNDVNAKSSTVFPESVWMVIHTMVSELRYIPLHAGF